MNTIEINGKIKNINSTQSIVLMMNGIFYEKDSSDNLHFVIDTDDGYLFDIKKFIKEL